MSVSTSRTRRLIVICSSLLIVDTVTSYNAPWPGSRAAALFIFGDSLFDAGTNNFIITTASFRADFVPYGETFFKHIPSGRFSDGLLIPDFIAEFAGLPLIPPYLQPGIGECPFIFGANFASGGAGALTETYKGLVVDLNTQTRQFEELEKQLKEKFGNLEAGRTVSEAVYVISIGANDYLSNSALFQSHSTEEYVSMVIAKLTTMIKKIHSKGGRKFGFVNVGPLGCIPQKRALAGRSGACSDEINKLPKLHNRVLPKALEELQKELDGFKFSIFDFFNAAMERIDSPSTYGFKESKIACCGSGPYRGNYTCGGRWDLEYELCKDPSEHLFFDSVHPSEKACRQLAESMWSGSPPMTGPCNLEALFKLA